ncbi:hypothetical protein GY45DRAFT_672210 [Cubamyces sp. BRFM 1775]|nr:hypothetical protein GY45DRAFT_672210 [Cubamyces sp. BRFM 1775]
MAELCCLGAKSYCALLCCSSWLRAQSTRRMILVLELATMARLTLTSADPLPDHSELAKCSHTHDFFHFGVLLAPLPHKFLRNDTTVHNAEDEAIIRTTLPRGHVNGGDMCRDVFLNTMRPTRDAHVVVQHRHAATEACATQRNAFVENFLLRPRLSKIVERWQCSAFAASMTRLRRRFSVPCHEQWTPASSKFSLLSKVGHAWVACDWTWAAVV